jgi:hypothetical protein
MQLVSADANNILKKNLTFFFAHENMKKPPSKVAHNWSRFFFQYRPGCPNGPKTEIPYHQKPINAGLGI